MLGCLTLWQTSQLATNLQSFFLRSLDWNMYPVSSKHLSTPKCPKVWCTVWNLLLPGKLIILLSIWFSVCPLYSILHCPSASITGVLWRDGLSLPSLMQLASDRCLAGLQDASPPNGRSCLWIADHCETIFDPGSEACNLFICLSCGVATQNVSEMILNSFDVFNLDVIFLNI